MQKNAKESFPIFETLERNDEKRKKEARRET